MIVKMNKTQTGSENGVNIVTFDAGEEYEISDELGRVFVEDLKCAELVNATAAQADSIETPEKPRARRGKRGQ